jgi:hypothetical protein
VFICSSCQVSLARCDNSVLRRLISQCESDIWKDAERGLDLLRNYLDHTMRRVGETAQVECYCQELKKSATSMVTVSDKVSSIGLDVWQLS